MGGIIYNKESVMSKKVREYLQDKEYNVAFEKLLLFMENKIGTRVDYDMEELKEFFPGAVSIFVYPWSNEELDKVFKNIDLKDKRALVVGSSGDQALHCIHKGATDVTIMDSNMWTKPYVELKLASIKNLSFEEFKDYFGNLFVFGRGYYPNVSHDLSEQAKAFWDSVELDFPWHTCIEAPDEFFHYFESTPDFGKEYMNKHCFYRSKEEYEKLQANLRKASVDIEVADIREFDELAKGKYDYIMLSNISDYMDKEEYFKITKALSENHLTFDGKMQIGYLFDWEKSGSKRRYYRALKECMNESRYGNIRIEKIKEGKGKIFSKKKSAENVTLER